MLVDVDGGIVYRRGMKKTEQKLCGLISDLHMEEYPYYIQAERGFTRRHPEAVESILDIPKPTALLDILIIAGDFCEYRHVHLWEQSLSKVTPYAKKVVIIDGNHEYWRTTYQKKESFRRHLSTLFSNIVFLDNSSVNIDGLEIFGTCLWTDFGRDPVLMGEVRDRYSSLCTDKNLIKIKWQQGGHRKIRPNDILGVNLASQKATKNWLDTTKDYDKRLFVSHYPPFGDAVTVENPNNKLTVEQVDQVAKLEFTDLSDDFSKHSDVVVAHGHLHGTKGYVARSGNVVHCNPRGTLRLNRPEYKIFEFTI